MIKLLIISILMLIIDILWIGHFSKYFIDYNKNFINVQKEDPKFRYIGGVFAYTAMLLGFTIFIYPKMKNSSSPFIDSLIYGASFGAVVYGVYNGTNYFSFRNWNKKVAIVDTLWGSLLYFILAYLSTL